MNWTRATAAGIVWIAVAALTPMGIALAQDEAPAGTDILSREIKGGVFFEREPIDSVIALIGAEAEITVTKTAAVQGNVTVTFPGDVAVKTLLDTIVGTIGARYIVGANGVIQVMTQEEFDSMAPLDPVITKRYSIRHRQARDLVPALESLLTRDRGQMTVDTANNTITVRDTNEAHARIQSEIQNLDTVLMTIIFNINYVAARDVAEALANILVGEPDIQVNERLNQVILRDTQSNILRAQSYVEQIDKDRELRVYHINFAWEQFDEIAGLIQRFASDDAIIETYEETRLIIVEDIPARQERIEQLVKAIDLPTRQVLIEAEIVRISNTVDFEFGSRFDYSTGELASATGANTMGLPVNDAFQWLVGMPEQGHLTVFGLYENQFQWQIRALESKGLAETLSSPRIVVRNDQDAEIKVATEEPFFVRQRRIGTVGSTDDEFFSQRSREVGSLLEITPHIMGNGYIDTEIFIEDSDADRVTLQTSGGAEDALRVFKRTATTRLVVRDGRTIGIGGLYIRDTRQNQQGLPFLSRIPILGAPFRYTSKVDRKEKLVLFVTPRIVSLDDPFGRRKDTSLERFGTASAIDSAATDFFPEERAFERAAESFEPGDVMYAPFLTEEEELLVPDRDDPTAAMDLLAVPIIGGIVLDDSVQLAIPQMSDVFGVPIRADSRLEGDLKFTINRDITLRELLNMIALSIGAQYSVQDGVIYLEPVPVGGTPGMRPSTRPAQRPQQPQIGQAPPPPAIVEPAEQPWPDPEPSSLKTAEAAPARDEDERREVYVSDAEMVGVAPSDAPEAAAVAQAIAQAGSPLQQVITGGLDYENVDIRRAVRDLERKSGVTIEVSRQVRGRVLWGTKDDITLERALYRVASSAGGQVITREDGGVAVVSVDEWLEGRASQRLVRTQIPVRNMPVEQLKPAVQEMLTQGSGSLTLDQARNTLLVEDSVEVVSKVRAKVEALDAAATPELPGGPRAEKRDVEE